jgi:hypothetical protein
VSGDDWLTLAVIVAFVVVALGAFVTRHDDDD